MEQEPLRRPGYFVPTPDGLLDAAVSKTAFTAQAYSEFVLLTRVIFDVQPVAFAFAGVEANHSDIGEAIALHQHRHADALKQGLDPVQESCQSFLKIARCLNNFLASGSAFVDQADRRLRLEYGETSAEARNWTELRRGEYDSRFSYRFMYHLRHYAQHYSIPLNNLRVNANRDGPNFPWSFEISLSIRRDELLRGGFDWKHARTELESQEEVFDLRSLAAEYLDSLAVLCRAYLDTHQHRMQECAHYLSAFVAKLNIPSKAWPVIFVGKSEVTGRPPGKVEWVPVGQFRLIAELLSRLPERTRD